MCLLTGMRWVSCKNVSFVFSVDLFIFSTGFLNPLVFVFFLFDFVNVRKSVFGNDPQKFGHRLYFTRTFEMEVSLDVCDSLIYKKRCKIYESTKCVLIGFHSRREALN